MRGRQRGFVLAPVALIGIIAIGIIITLVIVKPAINTPDKDGVGIQNNEPASTPTPLGNIKGKLIGGYYSKPVANAEILIDEEVKAASNSSGEFEITDITTGNHTISFTHPEYTFTSFDITINEGENSLEAAVFGKLTNPKPTTVAVSCFIDANKNLIKDAGESSIDGSASISFWESGKWVYQKSARCSVTGSYQESFSKIGKYKFESGVYTFYSPPGAKEVVVDGYGGTQTIYFGYIPQKVQAGFTIYVFNDKNENSTKDAGEENINYQYVRITNQSGIITGPLGSSYNSAVPETGDSFNQFEPGNYKFELIPENSSWETYYKVTKREASVTFSQNTPHQTIYLGAHKLY